MNPSPNCPTTCINWCETHCPHLRNYNEAVAHALMLEEEERVRDSAATLILYSAAIRRNRRAHRAAPATNPRLSSKLSYKKTP